MSILIWALLAFIAQWEAMKTLIKLEGKKKTEKCTSCLPLYRYINKPLAQITRHGSQAWFQ